MPEDTADRYVLLATLGDMGSARVFAARIEAEGIEVRLHGEALGPYRLTVGEMAATQLWVPSSQLAEATGIMLEAEVDATFPGDDGDGPADRFLSWRIVAAGVLLVIVAILSRVL